MIDKLQEYLKSKATHIANWRRDSVTQKGGVRRVGLQVVSGTR
jgi:hypothetical protein